MPNQFAQGSDTGYAFLSPSVLKRTKTLQNGITLVAHQQTGVIVNESHYSPWRHATFLIQETIVTDADGKLVREVGLCETVDADGDLTWSILWRQVTGPGNLKFIVGTGKWEGISGYGEISGIVQVRADDYLMPRWSINWQVDREASHLLDGSNERGVYTNHDQGFSFHGPHVVESTRELTNGIRLEVNNQSGVLMSEDREANSPRNFATSFDRGTTLMKGEERIADVMLLEDTDPDGDVVWLYHFWWYGTGPGRYRFIGGTGKWEGISGEGKTLGVLRNRMDDHWLLRSEMHWNISPEE